MAETENYKGTCFVVMGFGKKTDFESGRTLDLDKSYRNMIKPAVEAAGLKCIRADEIVHSGIIDVPMYEQLLNADVVVADLSTSNKNAFYELGVRHALCPFTTVVICEDGVKSFPFDVNHVSVRKYHHLGEDIGFEDVMKFREVLTKAITEIFNKVPRDKDSPVYTFLNNLTPPARTEVKAAIQEQVAGDDNAVASLAEKPAESAEANGGISHSTLMQWVDDALKEGDWVQAKSLLNKARKMQGASKQAEDPYIVQRLALITYKSKQPSEKQALEEAEKILLALNPATSNDTETLGLWGAVHKRLYEITPNAEILNEAVRAYERGFYLRNDYYNGINFAYLLNVRAADTNDHAEAIADFVQARRVRTEVKAICEKWMIENPPPQKAEQLNEYWKTRYWVQATLGEAIFGLNNGDAAKALLDEAYESAPESWMPQSTKEQLAKLEKLLDKSPLRYVKE
ncbi:MAG: TRAFs-binding domain-containing protein [Ferruginibacter sp.]